MYEFIIKETGELDALTYVWNNVECAWDVMWNWGFRPVGYDNMAIPIIYQDDFDWWDDIFHRLEALDECGVDWTENSDDLCDSDLEMRVEQMEKIARELGKL